jgi:hypothetical protein
MTIEQMLVVLAYGLSSKAGIKITSEIVKRDTRLSKNERNRRLTALYGG